MGNRGEVPKELKEEMVECFIAAWIKTNTFFTVYHRGRGGI